MDIRKLLKHQIKNNIYFFINKYYKMDAINSLAKSVQDSVQRVNATVDANVTYNDPADPTPQEPADPLWKNILGLLFSYSYLLSFLGAIFYSVSSIMTVDPTTILLNKNFSVAFNLVFIVASLLSLLYYFKIKHQYMDMLIPLGIFAKAG